MHPFRTAVTSAALATLTLGLVVVAAPAASAEPTTTELCALATSSVIGKLQSSGALAGLEVKGVPVTSIPASLISATAQDKLNCGSVPKISASEAKAKICPQLTAAGLRAFASKLGADAAAQGKITEIRVKNARTALECDKAGAPVPTSTVTPTGSATPSATKDPKPTGSSSASSTTTTKPAPGGRSYQVDLDCKDFPNQAAAQKVLDKDRSDPHNLDRDNDGLACELGDPSGSTRGDSTRGGSGTNSGGAGSYSQVGDGDVPVGAIATGGL